MDGQGLFISAKKITVCISLFHFLFFLVTRKGQFFHVRKEKINENTSSFVPVIYFIITVLIFFSLTLVLNAETMSACFKVGDIDT